MVSDSIKQMKKDIRQGLLEYMEKKDPGKSLGTYKTYASDSNYLINNGYEDEFIRFVRSERDMPEIHDLIRSILVEKRGADKVTDNGDYYYEKLCWQREYIQSIGGIDSLLGIEQTLEEQPQSNSDNPRMGAMFQKQVKEWFQKKYGIGFELEKKIPIGQPAKDHKFDIANLEKQMVIECKRYTWTKTGNVPSAKMGFTNEAAFYLSFLPDSYEKYIVMLRSFHKKRNETLAEYYYRTNRHLLGTVKVAEYDPASDELRLIGSDN